MVDLFEEGPDGHKIGRHPKDIGKDGLKAAGFEKKPLSKAIREKCLDCCCGEYTEVRKCVAVDCPLWVYRMGSNPLTDRKGGWAKPVESILRPESPVLPEHNDEVECRGTI